jgi:hypothetical protein
MRYGEAKMAKMEYNLLILCFIAHILGDYYFQTNKLALYKKSSLLGLFLHSILYSIPYTLLILFCRKNDSLKTGVILIIITHFIIDLAKYILYNVHNQKIKKMLDRKDWPIYFIDQCLHFLTIIYICFYYRYIPVKPILSLKPIIEYYNLSFDHVRWFLLVLVLNKPINITFNKLFSHYKPILNDPNIEKKENIILQSASFDKNKNISNKSTSNGNTISNRKAGAIIGFLERILIVIFLHINQFSAIGLILTAKSIARYEMISKNQEFGEYYLIGTLTSVLSSTLFYYLIFI